MKILQIKIYNLASLEGETIIDFTREPLASAGIFAITGPTGAGKSTILDALCLALYSRTPRYVQAGASRGIELQDSSGDMVNQGDPRAILRDGTAEGSASVLFEGIDKDHYEANWRVKRARLKVTGKLGTASHTLYNTTKGKEIPGTKTVIQKEIERLVGLNFEQFTRSVLLAQGDFTAFMKAGKEEKSALLEKLTGSQIYSEISQNIYEHYKTEEEVLKNLNAKATHIDLLTEEQISTVEEAISSYQQQMVVLNEKKSFTDKAVGWHRQKAEMEAKRQLAVELHETAESAVAALLGTKTQLEQAIVVRPLKPVRESLMEEQRQFQALSQSKQALSLKLEQLNKDKNQAAVSLQKSTREKDQKENALKDARPRLSKARALDLNLRAAKEQLDIRQTVLSQSLQTKSELTIEQAALQAKLTEQQNALQSAQNWMLARQDRRKIAEGAELITSRLAEAKRLLTDQIKLQEQMAGLTGAAAQLDQRIQTADAQLATTQTDFTDNKKALELLQQQVKQAGSEATDEALSAAQQKQRALDKAQALFDLYDRLRTDYEEARHKQTDNNNQIQILTTRAATVQPQVTASEAQLKTTRELITKASLRHAENIEKLRADLLKGEPCPVCGSTEHPYAAATHADLGDQLLDGLQEELTAAEKKYAALQHQYTESISACNLLKKQQQNLEETEKSIYEKFRTAEKQWATTALATQHNLTDKSPAGINDWFRVQSDSNKQLMDDLEGRKVIARQLLSRQEQLQQQTNQKRDALQQLRDELRDLRSNSQLKTQALSTCKTDWEKTGEKLQAIQISLSSYFTSDDWFSNWKTDPEKFTGVLLQFATDWKQKQQQVEALTLHTAQLETERSGLDRQLGTLAKQAEQQKAAVTQQKEKSDELTVDRGKLFNGRGADEVEKQLQDALEQAAAEAEQAKLTVTILENEWVKYHFEMEALQQTILQSAEKVRQLEEKITGWIAQHNTQNENAKLDITRVEALLELSEAWFLQTKETIQQAEGQFQDTKSRLQQREKDLQQHISSAGDASSPKMTLAELLKRQVEEQTAIDQLNMAIVGHQFQLGNHEKNLKKLGGFQKEIDRQQQIFDQWAALSSLIGSKDGRKFREIAQQYTLDLLLQYANQHLYVLSKRYILSRIEQSLGIQVIDQDMADEIRSVYSLSGGESFLVSLALALGLGSLSSHRLKVESLFIDEGFGALDPTTLSVAMDALERLQDQGRKVGVISHVQEMTERIAVQIAVHKRSSGKSTVTVSSIS